MGDVSHNVAQASGQFFQLAGCRHKSCACCGDFRATAYIAEGELGSERWIDTMPDNVTNNILAGDGNWYEIALDWIEIGLIYNADLAEQLGITMEWSNWTEFVADMVKVRDAGTIPVGMYLAPDWGTWWHADVIIWTAV